MAAILRSSVIQIVGRAFSGSGEGTTLSVRALHTGRRNNPTAYASSSSSSSSSCAREDLVLAYTERLVRHLLKNPHLVDRAVFCFVSMLTAGSMMLGYQVGSNQSRAEKERQKASSPAERKHD